jgi:hypothetical protein
MTVFAPQNVLDAPPFTKLDVLCYRKLLIYLNVETQRKLVPLWRDLFLVVFEEDVTGSSKIGAPCNTPSR